jgi:hypothetical protein
LKPAGKSGKVDTFVKPDAGALMDVDMIPAGSVPAAMRTGAVPEGQTGLLFRENGGILDDRGGAGLGSLDESLHAVESAKRELNYEVGTLVAQDGTVLREYGGTAHQVDTPVTDFALFRGNVFTHNHPGGRTFTLEDIQSFIESEAKEVRVSTPQGTFFSLRENDEEINRSIANVMTEEKVGSYMQARNTVVQKMMESGVELADEEYRKRLFDIMGNEMDRWLSENAREFGYLYAKGEL